MLESGNHYLASPAGTESNVVIVHRCTNGLTPSLRLKCDRGLPACSNCVHRGDIVDCRYVSRNTGSHTALPSTTPNLPEVVQRKLENLERLVLSLLNENSSRVSTDPRSAQLSPRDHEESISEARLNPEARRSDPGSNHLQHHINAQSCRDDHTEQRHSVDEARWASLFNEITFVRTYLQTQHKRYEDQNKAMSSLLQPSSDDSGPALLFGSSRTVSRSEILSRLPSKYNCDIMIARFFSHLYPPLRKYSSCRTRTLSKTNDV